MGGERKLFGYKKLELMRKLAEGRYRQSELAEMYDVSAPRISQFVRENAEQIAEIAENLADQFAGLWAAKKYNRISEYEAQVELARVELEAAKAEDRSPNPELLRIAQTAARSIAEELGQLPARVTVKHEGSIETRIVGVADGDITQLT